MPDSLSAYIPMDRRYALANGIVLADRAEGAVLFADISGFTRLTEALANRLGPRRGAEELARQLDAVYDALVTTVHAYGGSVVGFAGDAITCWFDAAAGDAPLSAAGCALALQAAIKPFSSSAAAASGLGLKVAVASGRVRRFVVGNPALQCFDVIAGRTVTRVTDAEHQAVSGQVWVDRATAARISPDLITDWRIDAVSGEDFALLTTDADPISPASPPCNAIPVSPALAREWVLPAIFERLAAGHGEFITELRPAAALFLHFTGIDYDVEDEAGSKLDQFVRWVQATVERFGGIVVQLTIGEKGSYLYAAFGAPVAHDDDARRAVNAARVLSTPPPGLSFVSPPSIGLSWGTMRTGAYGCHTRRTYGVLGDETNLAARLMQIASPGQVIASKRLVLATVRNFAWSPLAPIVVKGKSSPVSLFQLEAGGAETTASGHSGEQIVGRQAERAAISTAVQDTARGESRLVIIEGDAGLGKSRLLDALRREAEAAGLLVLAGAGDAIERSTPYHAWRDPIAHALGVDTITDTEARRRAVLAALEAEEWALAPLLNAVMPLEFPESPVTEHLSGPARVASTQELVIQILRRFTRIAPVALLLEDAQFMDSTSWAMALALQQRTHADPILFALTARSMEEPPTEFAHLTESANLTLLRLEPLGPQDAVSVAAQRLGVNAFPPSVADLIRARAEGNPFVSEELALALRDAGVIETEGTECRIAPGVDLRVVNLPDTVQGVITGRIDRLPAAHQLTLKLASVIGRDFDFPTLQGIHTVEFDRERLLAHLWALQAASLVLPAQTGNEMLFLFKHAVTHEVTYNLLLFAQRQALHRAIGEWLEQEYEDHLHLVLPRLAYHWHRAVEHADSPDQQTVLRAIDYLTESADQAARLSAFPEGIAAYEKALGIIEENGPGMRTRRASVLVELGLLLEKTGDYSDSIGHLEEGLRLALGADHGLLVAEALSGLCTVAWRQGRYDDAQQLGEKALEAADRVGAATARARALAHLGKIAMLRGDFEHATQRHEESASLFSSLGDRSGLVKSQNNLGVLAVLSGDYELAGTRFTQALESARALGDREETARVLSNLGLVAEKQGDLALAAERYEESLGMFRQIASRHSAMICVLNLGDVASAREDDKTARQHYAEVLAESISRNAVSLALGALRGIALLDARAGHFERAATLLGLALRHPSSDVEVRQQAEEALDMARRALGEEDLEAYMARGAGMSLEAMMEVVESSARSVGVPGRSTAPVLLGSS